MAVRDSKGSVGMGGRLRKKTGGGWVSTRQSSVDDILPSQDAGASRRAWRRLHVRRHGVRFEENSGKNHERCDVKVRGILSSGKRDVREIEILGRNLTWTEEGLEYEGSDKTPSSVVGRFGIERGVEGGQQCSHETGVDQRRRRRRNVGRVRNKKVQKFGSDVVQYAAKEVCTKMASPTRGSWKRLKNAGRYLKGVEKVTWKMGSCKNDDEANVDVHVDSN